MAKPRGPRPNPSPLRLVTGTHRPTRHGSAKAAREAIQRAQSTFGDLAMPCDFDDEAKAAWNRYIKPAWWLDASREVCAIAFCELWARFRRDPAVFPTALHTQMRCYMAELGLTDERNRFGVRRDGADDEFFD